ncbi:hypothetical protein ES332_D02G094700v1 [Gossypium tomentosum]|uniref:Auxin efflux carrier component n=1 Tax=Gossypium tomentosum TaxID=34277 RepID=A0A5D2LV20_GOSTO|nr:hypothetical protein ES332_D02G094700v1 [Gossypium tomentosum]
MITGGDFYKVMCAMVPLYFAMIIAYGSVKWWRIFSPEQCSGINRFVAVFAVPVLSFHFIAQNNPYQMDTKFIIADTVSKVLVLALLSVWAIFFPGGSLDWLITLFSLATLPNTLVMGIPLLNAMYGDFTQSLMVQLVVLQCIIWYTLLLFLFEYRAATLLIKTQFPGPTAATISKFELDNDVISLDGRDPLRTESETDINGRIRVRIRRSTSSAPESALSSSICLTPRASNLSNADIFSVNTPGGPNNNEIVFCNGDMGFGYRAVSPRLSGYASSDAYSLQPTPRASNFNEMDVITTAAGNTPIWMRSPVAGGKVFRQPSPVVPPTKMVWDCQDGGGDDNRQGFKDLGEKEISFRDNTKITVAEMNGDGKEGEVGSKQEMPKAIVMVECRDAEFGQVFNKNNLRCWPWDGNVQFRVIYGTSAKDYCMWNKKSNNGDGDSFPVWPCNNVHCIDSSGIKRGKTTCCHRTGSPSPRYRTIRLCKRIRFTSRHIKYWGYFWHVGVIACDTSVLHTFRHMKYEGKKQYNLNKRRWRICSN